MLVLWLEGPTTGKMVRLPLLRGASTLYPDAATCPAWTVQRGRKSNKPPTIRTTAISQRQYRIHVLLNPGTAWIWRLRHRPGVPSGFPSFERTSIPVRLAPKIANICFTSCDRNRPTRCSSRAAGRSFDGERRSPSCCKVRAVRHLARGVRNLVAGDCAEISSD